MIETIGICLAILLTVPLLAFAMIFSVGALCGVAAYHLSRQVVVAYQPMRKAFDPQKEKNQILAKVQKEADELRKLQTGYLEGIQLTREQYLAQENGK